jgi:transposase InsO family protein
MFEQIHVSSDEELLTVNTPRGLMRYNRLPYGVASAPAIAQETMERIVAGLDGVEVFIDDIFIASKDEESHLATLEKLFDRLGAAGARLNRSKCVFLQSDVRYLGHRISAAGVAPDPAKVRAVADMHAPCDTSQLKAFLGLVTYMSKFIPDQAGVCAPLYALLKKDAPFQWTDECSRAFATLKRLLSSAPTLAHYSSRAPLRLACDASSVGVGAVLSTVTPDGERPVAFASRTLTPAEANYSQLDKEALALVFGVRRFERYLLGRKFTLVTDHRPLMYILGPDKRLPTLVTVRVARWALFLAGFSYTIEFKRGVDHANADALSRLPLPHSAEDVEPDAAEVFCVRQLDAGPLFGTDVSAASRTDEVCRRAVEYARAGWPDQKDVPEDLKSLYQRRDALSVSRDCLFWGRRVVVPSELRPRVLRALHEAHPGVVRMKSLARLHVWWAGIDEDIEATVGECVACQEEQPLPSQRTTSWPTTTRPMERVSIDYAGPLANHKWVLVLVDAYSNWIEAAPIDHPNSHATIRALREWFSRLGLPDTLVSDNGSAFTSAEFNEFTTRNGIRHVRSPPFHPQSNGAAERAVRTVKTALKKADSGDLHAAISNFLLGQHATPTGEGPSPASRMMGRELTTRLQRLEQETLPDIPNTERGPVWIREYRQHGPRWSAGSAPDDGAPTAIVRRDDDGSETRRHRDQLRPRRVRRAPQRLDL